MKIIVTANNKEASHVLQRELIDLKNMRWLERKIFRETFDVKVFKNLEDLVTIEKIELHSKTRFPSLIQEGVLSGEIKKNLVIAGLTLGKDFLVEEVRP